MAAPYADAGLTAYRAVETLPEVMDFRGIAS